MSGKITKSFLVIIIVAFIVSILYISLANRDIKKETKEVIKLPEIYGDYYDLESRIDDLEWRVDDLESQMSDLEWRIDDLESLEWEIGDLESRISDLEWQIRY